MDVSTYPDLDPAFGLLSEQAAIAQVCARRLETPRGSLRRHPSFGFNVRAYALAKIDERTRTMLRAEIAAEVVKDQRVRSARVTVEHANHVLTIKLELVTAQGPFTLLLAADQVSVRILRGAQ